MYDRKYYDDSFYSMNFCDQYRAKQGDPAPPALTRADPD